MTVRSHVPTPLTPVALVAAAALAGLAAPPSAHAAPRPSFTSQVHAARRAGIGCDDIESLRLDVLRIHPSGTAARVAAACRATHWRVEWIVCEADRFGRCERFLSATQRAQLARAIAGTDAVAPAPRPVVAAAPVVGERARIDRIAVARGTLLDGGAGAARWARNTVDACVVAGTVVGGRASVEVRSVPELTARLTVDGPEPLRACLEGRLDQLVWTDGAENSAVRMRVTVMRRPTRRTRR